MTGAAPASFEQVVLPHLDAAYNLARWLVHDPSAAEDIVQDAVLRALQYFGSFRGGDGRAWLLQIVRNTAYSTLKARRAGSEVSLGGGVVDEDGEGVGMDVPDPAGSGGDAGAASGHGAVGRGAGGAAGRAAGCAWCCASWSSFPTRMSRGSRRFRSGR